MSQLQHRLTHNGAVTSVGSAQTRMDQSTKSLAEIRTCFVNELWNRRDLARADELFAPDCVTHQLSSRPGNIPTAPRGPEQIKHELTAWVQSFPDIAFAVEQAFEAGDCYVARYVVTGTHSGEWLGLPPTNRHVTMRMVHTVRVSDGQIVEDWLLGRLVRYARAARCRSVHRAQLGYGGGFVREVCLSLTRRRIGVNSSTSSA